jgi:nicotinate-nucleotide pyrophosphorylase (carboxylating)
LADLAARCAAAYPGLPDLLADADRLARIALAEDGATDVTTAVTVAADTRAQGTIESRTDAVFAGRAYAEAVARGCGCALEWRVAEGEAVMRGVVLGFVAGPLDGVLRAERPLLNLLQRACGIATATRAFVAALQGTSCRVLHTRKTAPGLRGLDVRSVLAGGGGLHRVDLARTVMVKDNHWRALRARGTSLESALDAARSRGVAECQVEVESLAEVEQACAARATRILVDNQSPETLRSWAQVARRLRPGIEVEATGGITLANVRAYAEAGADFVSIGALTHSVQAADIALDVSVV